MQASTIFKAKTRMLDIKNNFRNKSTTITCRACKKEEETQDHILAECPEIHKDENSKIKKAEINTQDTTILVTTSKKINKVMDILNKIDEKTNKKA